MVALGFSTYRRRPIFEGEVTAPRSQHELRRTGSRHTPRRRGCRRAHWGSLCIGAWGSARWIPICCSPARDLADDRWGLATGGPSQVVSAGGGIYSKTTIFQAPLSRRKTTVVGADTCCFVPWNV